MTLKCNTLWTNTEHSLIFPFLSDFSRPWDALSYIGDFIEIISCELSKKDYYFTENLVFISKSASVSQNAVIIGPCIVGPYSEIRPGAYIRGNSIIGKKCVIGNSTELKNSILFDSVQIPHFNYVGDSILGYKAHFGAGVITSNVKSDKSPVSIKFEGHTIDTGRRKLGALVGDHVEVGCNAVLNPGTVIGRNSTVYPLSSVRGVIPENSIYKSKDNIIDKE